MKIKKLIKGALPSIFVNHYYKFQYERKLPEAARFQRLFDLKGMAGKDPGNQAAILACLSWLRNAQDRSTTSDGGVARHFSLVDGWGPSYPETTGYIVPTFLFEAKIVGDETLGIRASRMLDWLVSIQFAEGGFQGGVITHEPAVPVTFNTGQILLGLAAGAKLVGNSRYLEAMLRAADWLMATQDPDGCWRRYPTPFAKAGEKAYETHVSWGLFEADRVAPGKGYGDAGLRQVRWALSKQLDNGWFADCCLNDPKQPLTHTIGYVLRGILEAYRLSQDKVFLEAGRRTAEAVLSKIGDDGFLAGRFDRRWRPVVSWSCLTGSVQISYCWLLLFEWIGDRRYLAAARKANAYVRRTIQVDGDSDRVGGVRGSYPVSGDYGQYEYLNWGAKFAIDAFRKELDVMEQ